jgi:hypothetical protein
MRTECVFFLVKNYSLLYFCGTRNAIPYSFVCCECHAFLTVNGGIWNAFYFRMGENELGSDGNGQVLLCCGVTSSPREPPANGDEEWDGYGAEAVLDWCAANQYEHVGIDQWRHAARGVCSMYKMPLVMLAIARCCVCV